MDAFRAKNFDLPENMFYFHNNDLRPLEFVLDWDSDDGFYKKLLNRYFANVLDKPNDHSIVLAKPNKTKYFHNQIPAFNIKYIEDCFRLKDYPDPNNYLIQSSCPKVYSNADIYDCWYHKKKTWFDLINSKAVEKPDCNDDNQNVTNRRKWISCYKTNSATSSSEDDSSLSSDPIVSRADSPAPSNVSSNKKTRLPYSAKEDMEIVKYIVKNKHAFNISGREMWEKMERANVCKIRSWQSMKERYLKHIKWDLQSKSLKYKFLSANDLKMLRQGLKIDAIKPKDKMLLKSTILEERINYMSSDDSS